jgi:hypothetical protein
MTRSQYEAHKADAAKAGFNLAGDDGQATVPSPFGPITLHYQYDETENKLSVTTLHKPFIVPESKIDAAEKQALT